MASKDKYNLVSGIVAEDVLADMRAKFGEWRSKMPFLVALTTAERQALGKPSADQLKACETLGEAAVSHPTYFPADVVDVAEMQRDLELAETLDLVATEALAFGEALVDTVRAARSDAFRAGLATYGLGKMAESKIPGLGEKIGKMRETLLKGPRSKPGPT